MRYIASGICLLSNKIFKPLNMSENDYLFSFDNFCHDQEKNLKHHNFLSVVPCLMNLFHLCNQTALPREKIGTHALPGKWIN